MKTFQSNTLIKCVISCAAAWTIETPANAQFILGLGENLGTAVNSNYDDGGSTLSADGLTMLFASGRPPGYHTHHDIFMATRTSVSESFGVPERLDGLINTEAQEGQPNLSYDGLSLFFDDGIATATTTHRPNGIGDADIWVASRLSTDDEFTNVENLGRPVNSEFYDGGASISADGLSLVFSSTRPGGSGSIDLWQTRRASGDAPWEQPFNLGATVNSSALDYDPSISPDGLALVFTSFRAGSGPYMTTRATLNDPWREPFKLGPPIDSSARDPLTRFSHDRSAIYFSSDRSGGSGAFDLWQVPLQSPEAVDLSVMQNYTQDFDILGPNANDTSIHLPAGWIGTGNGFVAFDRITSQFNAARTNPAEGDIFNAGPGGHMDRALATGVSSNRESNELQFRGRLVGADATQMRLYFDLEAWGSGASSTSLPGEAAFHLIAEMDTGDGFEELLDLGTVTTGPTLLVPEDRLINGNDDANRFKYDSSWRTDIHIPADAMVRLRWIVDTDATTPSWTFGLDNVQLQLSIHGDFNGDGLLDVADLDALTAEVSAPASDTQFDLNDDGRVDMGDVSIWITDIKNSFFGDTNLDGQVNAVDLNSLALSWQSAAATSWAQGDFNADGNVNASDLNELALNWRNRVVAASLASAVPEPSSLTLLLLGGIALVRSAVRRVG